MNLPVAMNTDAQRVDQTKHSRWPRRAHRSQMRLRSFSLNHSSPVGVDRSAVAAHQVVGQTQVHLAIRRLAHLATAVHQAALQGIEMKTAIELADRMEARKS